VALRSAGFEVQLAADGQEALIRTRETEPDCVVLDLRMPGMDGLQTAEKLRAMGFTGPMVLASAFADHTSAIAALRLGITDFLTKPVKPTQLRYAVNHALSRHARFANGETTDYSQVSQGLLRAYAKYCLSQRNRKEARLALNALVGVMNDLQSILLLAAIHEMDGENEAASELFVRAAEVHARSIPMTTSTELFHVFSHSDHSIQD
jgi:Response regulator containing CheY-like receiver, AAA-type ATPase, and DNA-binding domains